MEARARRITPMLTPSVVEALERMGRPREALVRLVALMDSLLGNLRRQLQQRLVRVACRAMEGAEEAKESSAMVV